MVVQTSTDRHLMTGLLRLPTPESQHPHDTDTAKHLQQLQTALGAVSWSLEPGSLRLLHLDGDTRSALGIAPHDLPDASASVLAIVHPEDRDRVRRALQTVRAPSHALTCRLTDAGGATRWVSSTLFPVVDVRGILARIDGVTVDITARMAQETALDAARQRVQLTRTAMHGAWWEWDVDADHLELSRQWYALLGDVPDVYDRQPAPADRLFDRIHPHDVERVRTILERTAAAHPPTFELECRLQHVDGHDVHVRLRGVLQLGPDTRRIMGSALDLTALRQAEARQATLYRDLQRANLDLERQATLDPLTGVANRRGGDDALHRAWSRAQADRLPIALIHCLLDDFTAYGEFLVHAEADRCLARVAWSISDSVRSVGGRVARSDRDRFTVVLLGVSGDELLELAERIQGDLAALRLAHPLTAVHTTVSLSLGVACTHPAPDTSPQTLLSRAEDALLSAARSGWNHIEVAGAVAGRDDTEEAGC